MLIRVERSRVKRKVTTWQENLKKCAREWQEMKKSRKDAERANKKKVPPRVPKRIRGKQSDPARDLN